MSRCTRVWAKFFAVGALCAPLFPVPPAAAQTPAQGLTAAQMREDLAVLGQTWARKDRSFTPEGRERFEHALRRATTQVEGMHPHDFALEVARLAALSGNGHSAAHLPAMPSLPVRLWWFDDGLFVVSARADHAGLVGAKIERIGRASPEEALQRVSQFIPGNDAHRKVESTPFLTNPRALERAGISPGAETVALTVRDRSGTRRQVELHADAEPARGNSWEVLLPEAMDAPGRWVHVLDALQVRPAAFRSETDLEYEWLSSEPRVLYLRSNRIYSVDEVRLDLKLFEMTMKELVDSAPQAVIVDLRYNMGGNYLNTILFAQALPELVAAGGKVLVLTGPVTFSAALVTAAMLEMHGDERVLFVGEVMGDEPRFWAEGGLVQLPHSGIEVRYSDYFHDWGNPCREAACLWATRIFGPKRPISLAPDVRVPTTFADYARGADAVLTAALALALDADVGCAAQRVRGAQAARLATPAGRACVAR